MFGGFGLYLGGTFFGIVYQGQLFFKTDATTRREYTARGMTPFRPNPRQTLKSYYEVPADILEDTSLLAAWAKKAVQCQGSQSQKAGYSKQTFRRRKM